MSAFPPCRRLSSALLCFLLTCATLFPETVSAAESQCKTGGPFAFDIAGNLEDAGYIVSVLGSVDIPHQGLLTVGNALNHPLEVQISSTSRPFRKLAVVVSDEYNMPDEWIKVEPTQTLYSHPACTNAVLYPEPSSAAAAAADTTPQSVGHVTVSVPVEASLQIDVTLQAADTDEYYYSTFRMEVTSRSLEQAFADCLQDLVTADANQDAHLDRDEYYQLVTLMGVHRCYTPTGQLTVDQSLTYDSLSCKSCVQMGGGTPEDCCIEAPNALPIAGATKAPSALSIDENAHFRNICQSTYARIEPACTTDPPTPSPSAAPNTQEEQNASGPKRTLDLAECISMLADIDDGSDGVMKMTEYAKFISQMGQENYCHAAPGIFNTPTLDSYQTRIFHILACNSCQSQDKQTTACCRDEYWSNRVSIRGATSDPSQINPATADMEQLSWLASVCVTTDSIVQDKCGGGSTRTRNRVLSVNDATELTTTTEATNFARHDDAETSPEQSSLRRVGE